MLLVSGNKVGRYDFSLNLILPHSYREPSMFTSVLLVAVSQEEDANSSLAPGLT